jgi:acetolactate synthase-1/2/3 large subunit
MRLADAIFERVKRETNTVYFVAGGGAMFLVDALGKSGLNAVAMIHEQGAGVAAIGHAMASGGLGVCLTTSGPGATNAQTACLAAWTDSVPVLFISGQTRTEQITASKARARGLQYADIVRMAYPITKKAYEPMNTHYDCLMALDHMIDLCLSGRRGPCWLSVPQDLQGLEYE